MDETVFVGEGVVELEWSGGEWLTPSLWASIYCALTRARLFCVLSEVKAPGDVLCCLFTFISLVQGPCQIEPSYAGLCRTCSWLFVQHVDLTLLALMYIHSFLIDNKYAILLGELCFNPFLSSSHTFY